MARTLGLPVRGVTLVFWGGATETRADLHGPLGEFLVASVGPATTLALSGCSGWPTSPPPASSPTSSGTSPGCR